ncbi:UNVERIFIED_CONTAM: F-box protein [Sesamum calycinum]|uniref:F-box protein n=1 Tax=Sesamum calycinum TaxID=2727403 RepID=A0AAW2LQR2_9LAMI
MSFRSSSVTGRITWNDDMLIEILLWLPTKSLTRFKLVSKHWLSLISAPQFSHLHTLRHLKLQPSLILHMRASQFFYFHPLVDGAKLIPYHFTIPNPKILSSCNGLLLLQSDYPQKDYYVYNPTTKQSKNFSLTNNDHKYTIVLGLNLAFDPSKSPHYKIVCVRGAERSPSSALQYCQIKVYDSNTQSWKLCLEPFIAYITTQFSHGVHWNNAIHWENHPFHHLYFDLDKNVIQRLPYVQTSCPARGEGTACHFHLQESNGHLHHLMIMSELGDKSIAVLKLTADYPQWSLKYHDRLGWFQGTFRILNFTSGDSKETRTLVFHVPGKITAYKFLDRSFKQLVDLTNQTFYQEDALQFDSRDVHQFGESLAPV